MDNTAYVMNIGGQTAAMNSQGAPVAIADSAAELELKLSVLGLNAAVVDLKREPDRKKAVKLALLGVFMSRDMIKSCLNVLGEYCGIIAAMPRHIDSYSFDNTRDLTICESYLFVLEYLQAGEIMLFSDGYDKIEIKPFCRFYEIHKKHKMLIASGKGLIKSPVWNRWTDLGMRDLFAHLTVNEIIRKCCALTRINWTRQDLIDVASAMAGNFT